MVLSKIASPQSGTVRRVCSGLKVSQVATGPASITYGGTRAKPGLSDCLPL